MKETVKPNDGFLPIEKSHQLCHGVFATSWTVVVSNAQLRTKSPRMIQMIWQNTTFLARNYRADKCSARKAIRISKRNLWACVDVPIY